MNSGSVLRQQFYHSRLPLDLQSNFETERKFFWSEIIHTISTKDIVNQAGIAGSNIKQLIVKFKNVYGLKREEHQAIVTMLIEMIFKRKNVRTDSKVLLINFLNEMLASRVELKGLKLDWRSYYEFYLQEFHNNDEKPYRNESQNISFFSEFIALTKRSKKYFDPSSIPKVYEIFKENYQPSRADYAMNFLTLFLKIDQDSESEVYAPLLEDLIHYLNFSYCSRNTLTLYNIMKILREFKNLQWEKHYDEIFTVIFRNLNNLLILDTAAAEENIISTLLPEEPIGIKSIFKQIPDFMVHLLLPSTHPKYEIVWQYIERIFLLIDRVFDPNTKSEQCDSLLKLFKCFVRKFIIRYESDQFNRYNLAENPLNAEEDGADILDLEFNDSEYNIPEYLQEKKRNKGTNANQDPKYILDEVCKERFLQLMDSFLKKLVYMEDPSHSSCKLIQWLCYFDPSRYAIPTIEHIIQSFTYVDDMALTTVKGIALFIMPVLCDRKLCPGGLKYALQFLKVSFKLFEVQGLKDNIDLIEAYSKFFTYVPLNRYKDLLQSFKSENLDKGEKELLELISDDIGGSEFDSLEFIQQTEIFAVKFFQLVVENVSSLDLPDSESCTLIIDFNNLFWTFIVNSSHSLRVQYVNILFQKLQNNIIPEAQQAIAYLLDCLSLTEPELILETTIQLMKEKVLKKRTDPETIEKMKQNAMWFMLENNENKDRILEYEFALFSDVSIKYYVNILENAMSYSRTYLLKHIDTVETIAYLCFFQDDLSVFEKSCDIIHTVILTLGYTYPLEVSFLNPSERQYTDQSKYQYLQRLGKTNLKKFQLEWYSPGPKERAFINKWIQKTIYKAFAFFQINYFDKPEFPIVDFEKDYMKVIHDMLFDDNSNNLLAVSKLQKDFYKYLYVALAVFSGINVRVPFIKSPVLETDRQRQYREIYKNFEDKFMFEDLSDLRNDLTELCMKLPSLFHHTKTINDSALVEIFQYLIRECFGESYLIEEIKRSNEMIDGLCTLNDFHRPNVFSNRFTLASECVTFLNEKIDMFFFLNPYLGSQKMALFNSFFILSFHPTYTFRMSVRFDHDLNFSLTSENIYEPMHKKAFAIMNHYVKDQKIFLQEMTPTIEKVQEMLLLNLRIESLQRFPCCAANPDTFHYIFSCLEVFEQLDKKIWQQKVIDQIVKTLTITYEDAYLFAQLRPQHLKQCTINPIIESCELYTNMKQNLVIERDSISKVQALKVQQAFLEIIAKANDKAEDPKTHWKSTVLSGLFVVYFLNVIEDFNHPEIVRFTRVSTAFATDKTDFHLAQYGRAILFRILNLRKRRVVKKIYEPMPGCFGPTAGSQMEEEEDTGEGEYTLSEFYKYHFLKKKDLSSYLIKSREIGAYFGYGQLYNKTGYEMLESDGELAKVLIDRFTDPVFFQKYIESVFEAKEIYASDQDDADAEAVQVDLGQGEVFEQIQILFNFTFDSDKKKSSLFSINLSFNLFEFNARLLKKAFQALGDRFFKVSSPIISALVDDYNNLPKQRVISIYVWSVLKWTQRVPKSERKQYMDYCVNLGLDCITNCSLELFRDWLLSVSLACKNNTFENIEEFFSRVLAGLKNQKSLGKRFRYHKLLKIMITLNQSWARNYALEGLQMIIDSDVEDIKECDENTELFAEILCSTIINRINICKLKEEKWIKGGVQQHIDSNELIIQDEYTAFENNQLITKFISQLFEKLKNEKNDSKKKLYSHMTFKVLDSISVRRLNDLFWGYFRPFFTYILDNKPDNVNEIEILKMMSCNEYPQNIRKDLKSILAEKIVSDNWVSRQKVILFCKNFLYFEEYEENLVQVDNLILKGLTDKNNSVSLLAVECLGEILKLATKEEQNNIFQKYRVLSQTILPKDKQSKEYHTLCEKKQIAVQVLMSLLLAFREEVLPWTEDALREVISAKTINPNMKKKVKEFVGQYWRDQTEVITFNSLTLTDKTKKLIREIANPFDYFA